MAIQTWVFWTAMGFQAFIGIMITLFTGWFLYMRGSGQWGGGSKVIDFSAFPEGELREFRILKKGPLYVHSNGGDTGVVIRQVGIFKTEHMRIKLNDMVRAGSMFFFGRKGLEKAFEIDASDKQAQITLLRNRISQVNHELAKKDHKIEDILDKNTKLLNDTAKAMYGFNKPSTGVKKK